MGVITKSKCNNKHSSDKFPGLRFENWSNIIALKNVAVKGLLMMCANRNVWECHLIVASMSIDYKEQVVIISIKSGMQYLMSQVPPKERENFCKMWPKRTHNSMHA